MSVAPCVLTAVVVCALAVPALAQSYTDDFSSANDAAWTRYEPLAPFGAGGTFTFPDGAYRLQAPPSPSVEQLGACRVGAAVTGLVVSDFLMSVDLMAFSPSGPAAMGMFARVSNPGLGTTSGYFAHVNNEESRAVLVIDRIVNEAAQKTFGRKLSFVLDPAVPYRLTFSGQGSLLIAELYDLADTSTPIGKVTAYDTRFASGLTGIATTGIVSNRGVYVSNPHLDATFDNFTVGPNTIACPGGWDDSGMVDSADFFSFLTSFFAGDADINYSGTTDSADFFDFLLAFYNGC